MGVSQLRPADRAIRWVTTASVVLLAGIAAVVSYQHMYTLVIEHGETRWAATLLNCGPFGGIQ